ncbi:hypothetical protein [Fictibacillus phosphorivorans]|uniref:hypothetical protein n=1 Tax=Fictibacillus phosphorivorans TaxID=1221500 RepID=UPI00203AC006|nr:hypothetical protein [Fictibacillus phosphorivorans]MCM3719164.1 hypothetical protein [Fictibacillus phosphorivorans]MCM3776786.1 hypothetical protein [Fictibacillus phosphorivorans]
MKDLKSYIVSYRNGSTDSLNHLIGIRKVKETNAKGEVDVIPRIKYNDKALNTIYFEITKKYYKVDNKDIEEWFLNGLCEVIFEKADINRTPQEIISWTAKTLDGYIHNKTIFERKDDKHTEPEQKKIKVHNHEDDENLDDSNSLYDSAVYKNYIEVESSKGYIEFIDFIGGVKNILTPTQYKLYKLMQDVHKKQKDLAKELGCTPENISKQVKQIHRKIKENWIYFKSVKSLTQTGLYENISKFVEQYKTIEEIDTDRNFDYFALLVKYLKTNYKKGEQTPGFKDLHKNKVQYHLSVFDILVDSLSAKSCKVLYEILESDIHNVGIRKRDKIRIAEQSFKVFRDYIEQCNVALFKVSGLIAKQKEIEFNNIHNKIS